MEKQKLGLLAPEGEAAAPPKLLLAQLLQDVAEFGQDQLLHGEADGVFGAGGLRHL